MLWIFCVVVLGLGCTPSSAEFTPNDANKYIDSVIAGQFREEVEYSKLEPFSFPNIETDLPRGSAVLTQGKLHNLSKVRRLRSCSVPQWSSANVTFTCPLTFDRLVLNYTANVTHDNDRVQMTFYPSTIISRTNVTAQVTTTPQENIPNLRLFLVNAVGPMTVKVQMVSIGNLEHVVGPPIREAIVKEANKNLHKTLNGRFKDALAYSVYKTPVEFVE